ncbi:MAG TPA: radical SAM protein, partial [Steroidobacteraceae bacterium]|nr:radical SAM protein [Steroidobacteraceae bacterium]
MAILGGNALPALPPLSLYVHFPWCVRKCHYCDFNSHALRSELPERRYIDALLADLAREAPFALDRPVQSIFLGGGTPSLFSPAALARLLEG